MLRFVFRVTQHDYLIFKHAAPSPSRRGKVCIKRISPSRRASDIDHSRRHLPAACPLALYSFRHVNLLIRRRGELRQDGLTRGFLFEAGPPCPAGVRVAANLPDLVAVALATFARGIVATAGNFLP